MMQTNYFHIFAYLQRYRLLFWQTLVYRGRRVLKKWRYEGRRKERSKQMRKVRNYDGRFLLIAE